MPFYAVCKGRNPGIYETWAEAEKQVKQHPGAIHKKFKTKEEAISFMSDSTITAIPSVSIFSEPSQCNFQALNSTNFSIKLQDSTLMSPLCLPDPIRLDINDGLPLNAILCDGQLQYLYTEISDEKLKERLSKALSSLQQKLLQNSKQRKKAAVIQSALSHYLAFKKRMTEAPDKWEIAFTDGACTSNGKSGAMAGIGVYWESSNEIEQHHRLISVSKHPDATVKGSTDKILRHKSCKLLGKQTNNRAELTAIYAALRGSSRTKSLLICTDSSYAIKCLTEYMPHWRRNGWKRSALTNQKYERKAPYKLAKTDTPKLNTSADVLNIDILLAIDFLKKQKEAVGLNIQFLHVPSHCGIEGNEIADSLASLALQTSLQ